METNLAELQFSLHDVIGDQPLIQFAPQATEVDEQALDFLWEKGRKAWQDVK